MYLMDSIIECAERARVSRMMRHPIIGIFPIMQRKLDGCPRFMFDDASIHTAVELTLGRPKVLKEAMDHLRIPYTKMWVEWNEAGRQKLRDTFGAQDKELTTPLRPLPRRLGFLLEVDDTGRKGTATWAWSSHVKGEDEPPNICPISPFFDLDEKYPQDNHIIKNFLTANIANLWKDNPIQLEALLGIWETSLHKPSDWGITFLAQSEASYMSTQQRLSHYYADVYGEYIMIWACLMLLTSSKKILELKPVDMSWLNKKRAKKGVTPKLDHTMVCLHVNQEIHIHQQGVPLGHERKSPRIHMVSSYLARRGNKHWIVQPYWRGSGEVISRHVKVKT